MLINAAAEHWSVSPAEWDTHQGKVRHPSSGRELSYAQLSEAAADQAVPQNVKLKNRDEFQYIGKSIVHVDAENIATGVAAYGADVTHPNMVVAVMVRGPSLHAKAVSVSIPDEWKQNKRFVGVETIDPTNGPIIFNPVGGGAAIATDTHTAMKASSALEIDWEETDHKDFNSGKFQDALRGAVTNPANVVHESGNVDAEFEGSTNSVEGIYETSFLSHAPMEPPVAFADVQENSVTVHAPVQDPQSTRAQVAAWLKVNPATVTVTPTLLGGAFGEKVKTRLRVGSL